MNKQENDILNMLLEEVFANQRMLAEASGHSLGVVNRSLKELTAQGYVDENMRPTRKAVTEAKKTAPKNAIILAAGFGMRMVPINNEVPKGLLEVNGEALIERTIRQLHEAGITEVYVVVGFMKEQYEYLIDEYGVELVVNPDYAAKNNLHSVSLVAEHISNTYIIPCDNWCAHNPYHAHEMYSWYMVSERLDPSSTVRVNRKMELQTVPKSSQGNAMIGISYLTGKESAVVKERIDAFECDTRYNGAFWEETLYDGERMIVAARLVGEEDAAEINTYEQLRALDRESNQLQTDAIQTICQAFLCAPEDVTDIQVLKKGMTNRSFLFTCRDKKYIMRIPGEGTDQLINRREEAAVYETIRNLDLCDAICYINPENGYKITEFIEGARVCDPTDDEDLEKCMKILRGLHGKKLKVDHTFDLFEKIDFYEKLWGGVPSAYKDYKKTKAKMLELKEYIDEHRSEMILTHIDANQDNFLFSMQGGKEDLRLIDWEYAGMQDPLVDVAMFAIYALYDKKQTDHLIDIYFEGDCTKEQRMLIYCYMAVCGLIWSNWCEYKRNLGVEFGEYSLRQYRYAKEYYKVVRECLAQGDVEGSKDE